MDSPDIREQGLLLSGMRAPAHSAQSNRPEPSTVPSEIQFDFGIPPRARLRRQCAIPDPHLRCGRDRPALSQIAQSRAKPAKMPAAMTALPSTILRRTSLITGSPVSHAANQPVSPRAKRMATNVNASSSPRGSHVIAASGMTAPMPAVKAAGTPRSWTREPRDAVLRPHGQPPDPVR
jgi:hypothetical protein